MDLKDCEALYKEICRAYEYEYPTASGAFDEFVSKTLKNIIYNTPTVDAVRHGKWIKTGVFTSKCSECNHRTTEDGANYCPNCGAKMERIVVQKWRGCSDYGKA